MIFWQLQIELSRLGRLGRSLKINHLRQPRFTIVLTSALFRWREGFTLTASSTKLKKYCKNQIMASKQRLLLAKEALVNDGQIFESNAGEDITTWESQGWEVNSRAAPDWKNEAGDANVALAVDFMGGLDSRSAPF